MSTRTPVVIVNGTATVVSSGDSVDPAALGSGSATSSAYLRGDGTWTNPWASPALTGTATAPTPTSADNSTNIATTAYVQSNLANYTTTSSLSSTYAPLASPVFTGTPEAPTAAVDTDTIQLATTAFVIGQASSTTPGMDGAAAIGTATRFARADHIHPTDTSRAPLASPSFTGVPAAPTAAVDTDTTQLATTAFVINQAASSNPLVNGTAAVGTATRFARADHVHPSDTSLITRVATMAALKAQAIPLAAIVVTLGGYYTDGDGAGGIFIWSPSSSIADDSGTVINPTGNAGNGRWLRLFNDAVNVKWFGAKGDGSTDDSSAIQAALNYAQNHPGTRLFTPDGTFIVSNLNIYSNTTLFGNGWTSVFKQISTASYVVSINAGSGGSADPSTNIKNVVFRDMQFLSTCDTDGFSEHVYLLNLNAASDVLVENCLLKGFRGDGIYIGSSNNAATERHNERITIRKCYFDGIDHNNRNGVTVIDGSHILIDDCYFANCTASNMPGAIDIEPNGDAFSRIRDITVRKCRFYNVGGSVGVISLNLPLAQSSMTLPMSGLTIEDCTIDCTGGPASGGIYLSQTEDKTDSAVANDITVSKVRTYHAGRDVQLYGVKNVRIKNGDFNFSTDSSLLAYSGTNVRCQDIELKDCVFKESASSSGGGAAVVFNIDRLAINGCVFIDCGKSDGTAGYALDFNSGTSSYVSLLNCRILSPKNYTKYAIQKEAGHTFNSATNTFKDVDLISVTGNAFIATRKDVPFDSPAFTGTPTAPTVATSDNSTSIATTAWVKLQGYCNTIHREEYTATSGQTVFTLSNAYTVGNSGLHVYVAGILKPQSSYTETNSTTVTFNTGLVAGDEVVFINYVI